MFINADPRSVSNGSFDTFVQYQPVEFWHQRLVEMTNTDVNAWSVFSPVSRTSIEWEDQQIGFHGNDNLSNVYGGHFEEMYSTIQEENFGYLKTTLYPASTEARSSDLLRVHYDQNTVMSCAEHNPMLVDDYAQWSLGRGRGSFAEFSKSANAAKNFQHQNSENLNDGSFSPNSSGVSSLPPCATVTSVPIRDSFNVEKASPTTRHSSYSPTNISLNPSDAMTYRSAPAINKDLGKNDLWQSIPRNCKGHYSADFDNMLVHDGLPMYNFGQQPHNNLWNYGPNVCAAQIMTPNTVSPKDILTLEVPLAMSTSGSSQGTSIDTSDSSTSCSSQDNSAHYSASDEMFNIKQPILVRRQRQMLPAEPVNQPRQFPILPGNDLASSGSSGKSSVKKKSDYRRTKIQNRSSYLSSKKSQEVSTSKLSSPQKIEPKPAKIGCQNVLDSPSNPTLTDQTNHHRSEKDSFLIQSKLAGMSYKEIRRKGKFTEAESTLRGRFRTLTKHKMARVRKPEWDDNDNRLLKKAVRRLTQNSDSNKGKIPWKQVAEYIANNGGSYHFGNSTCRKHWEELQGYE